MSRGRNHTPTADSEQPTAQNRRILHVDVDAMFVQCAILADPDRLADEALILVGGSAEGRGVVTSASYGCRAFGVRSAMPMATALRLCPRAVVVRVPGDMIRTKSREFGTALEDWSPVVSKASVDEAYLDLSGTEALYHHEPLEATARRIQRDLKLRTELDVSLGGASNRLVAKLATSFAKPAGVFIVQPGTEADFVSRLEIRDLLGVGPALEESLRRRGITTMRRLLSLELATLASWLGEDRAHWLWRRCRGIDTSPVSSVDDDAKSVSSATTFARDLHATTELEEALLAQVVDAAGSLRKKQLFARTVTVRIRDSDFRDRSRGRTLTEPVQTERAIFRVARELLVELRGRRFTGARLIGVALTNLSASGDNDQGVLLDIVPPAENEKDRAIAHASDRLRTRFGHEAIKPGRLLRPPS